jgi:hypothetical protein
MRWGRRRFGAVAGAAALTSALPRQVAFGQQATTPPPPLDITIGGKRFLIPPGYVRTAVMDPPGVELFVRWPSFGPFAETQPGGHPGRGDWDKLLIVNFDGALAVVPVDTHYQSLRVLLGTPVLIGEHDGLSWEGPGPDANPYDPHEIGTSRGGGGDVTTFLICQGKIDICQMHMETIGGAITIDFSKINQTKWAEIETGMRRLISGWEHQHAVDQK